MRKAILVMLAAAALLVGSRALADARQEAATKSAEAWLALLDQGRYDASWDAAAPYFQRAVEKKTWEQQLSGVRKPLGKTLSRRRQLAESTQSLAGAPDGEYVVIQFATSFENKAEATETVTMMQQQGGGWKVSGYYFK
jgi:Protein of unknown function (DUF4019)